jgi:hypothetical protein
VITAEQIPDEVVEAAAKAAHDVWRIQASVGDDINEYAPLHEMPANLQQEYREEARAAIAAALSAWPGMFEEYMNDEDGDGASLCVILPQEARDE